ncbi:MAG: hypothetical protein AAB352_02800 [Patescibacteria group bacterium]
MHKFNELYSFIDFAKGNRKYLENTANNLKSALKIFENALTDDELDSISLFEDRIEEIFINVINSNKDKSIVSLNTYKARVLKVLSDYKKYGEDPAKINKWFVKTRNSTPLLTNKDKSDKEKINLSNPINTSVHNTHKIELSLRNDTKSVIIIPKDISQKEIKMIKDILDSILQ